MAFRTQKISQMTPKGANLEGSDLLEVSTLESGSYVTRSITGQDIIDAAAGTGITNITTNAPLATTGGSTPDLSISEADGSTDGYLTAVDWSTFNSKQAALVSGTNIKTIEGQSLLGSGNINITATDVGLGNVDNTSDLNKPISTATQTALNAKQDTLTLTTTGTSGAATLVGATLNIPQYSGGGANNLKFTNIQLNNGVSVTNSTTETITYSVLVPANTFISTAFFDVTTRFTKTGSLTSWSARIYKNTSNTLTGATLIATIGNPFTLTQIYSQGVRFFRVSSSTIRYYQANFANVTDNLAANNNEGSTTFDLSVDNYFLVTIQLGTAATDTIRGVMSKFLGYE